MNSPMHGHAWSMHGHAWDVTFYMDHAWDRMGPQYGYSIMLHSYWHLTHLVEENITIFTKSGGELSKIL